MIMSFQYVNELVLVRDHEASFCLGISLSQFNLGLKIEKLFRGPILARTNPDNSQKCRWCQ